MTQTDHDQWHARWRENRIGFHRSEVHPALVDLWPELDVAADARVFVPLAGKSIDMHWLAARGHEVLGVELSELAVRGFFEDAGLKAEVTREGPFAVYRSGPVELRAGDVFDLRPEDLRGVRGLYDRASVVALDPTTRRRYADHLAVLLSPGCEGLVIGLESPAPDEAGPPFSVPRQEIASLFDGAFERSLLRAPDFEGPPEARGLFEHVHAVRRR